MAMGDILLYDNAAFGYAGDEVYAVAAGTTASINAGELVLQGLGANAVTVWTASNSAKPVVGTDFTPGVATTASSETASAAGTVRVTKFVPGVSYLGNPDVAATWNTQAKYDALVGARVLLKTSAAGVQTILAADGATQGLVVMPLDIARFPGKVRFAMRAALNPLA